MSAIGPKRTFHRPITKRDLGGRARCPLGLSQGHHGADRYPAERDHSRPWRRGHRWRFGAVPVLVASATTRFGHAADRQEFLCVGSCVSGERTLRPWRPPATSLADNRNRLAGASKTSGIRFLLVSATRCNAEGLCFQGNNNGTTRQSRSF
jgi:hypothetical protein